MNVPLKMRMACLAALAGATLAIGCGGDDEEGNANRYDGDESDVAAVVDDLAEAGSEGDGARVCDELFTEALAKNIELEAKKSCQSEVQEQLPDDYELTVEEIVVKGTTATATVTDQADNRPVLHMLKTGDDWRIHRVSSLR